jgi:hypothetical protein
MARSSVASFINNFLSCNLSGPRIRIGGGDVINFKYRGLGREAERERGMAEEGFTRK